MSCYINIYVCGYIFWNKTWHAQCDWGEYISRYGSRRANVWNYLRTPGHLNPADYIYECFVSLGLNFRDKGWFSSFFVQWLNCMLRKTCYLLGLIAGNEPFRLTSGSLKPAGCWGALWLEPPRAAFPHFGCNISAPRFGLKAGCVNHNRVRGLTSFKQEANPFGGSHQTIRSPGEWKPMGFTRNQVLWPNNQELCQVQHKVKHQIAAKGISGFGVNRVQTGQWSVTRGQESQFMQPRLLSPPG